ncbi:MAG: glutamate synthase large subunit [Culicoidibacterales bacterium]
MVDYSNCGIGAIANRDGKPSHDMIQQGMKLLQALSHRGGKSSDGTGDGCGILLAIPQKFYEQVYGITEPFAVMMCFLPTNEAQFYEAEAVILTQLAANEQQLLKRIDVSVDERVLPPTALANQPRICQYIIACSKTTQAQLYPLRRQIEQKWQALGFRDEACHIVSCSAATIVYKGLLTPEQLPMYYRDLQNPQFGSNFCVVHQRFSTNTTPAWHLAQPFRYLAHNGEINTVSGNIQWANAKQTLAANPQLYPICDANYSDSANLDRALEAMLQQHSLADAVARLLPKAYEHDQLITDDLQAYYEYAELKNEPWDGPAGVIVCDGKTLVATLDRNGLRPFRVMTTTEQLILASEIGVLDTPLTAIETATRVQASELLCFDLTTGTLINDATTKALLAKQQPYRSWLEAVEQKVPAIMTIPTETYPDYAQKFKYTKAEFDQELNSLLETGTEAIGSFPHTAQLPMLQPHVSLLFDYLKQNFAQVTNPPLDSLREHSIFSTAVRFTSVQSLQDEALTMPLYHFDSPILTANQYDVLIAEPAFVVETISLQYETTLEQALNQLTTTVAQALQGTTTVIVLDDQGVKRAIPSILALSVVHNQIVAAGKRLSVRLVVKCADARLPLHYAQLIAFGADVIYPYYAYAYLNEQTPTPLAALARYRQGCNQTLLKLMAKMGVATVAAYRGSKVFEIVGLDATLTAYFTNKPALFGGISLAELDASLAAIDETKMKKWNEYLNQDSTYMSHAYSKTFIKEIKASVLARDYEQFLSVTAAERQRQVNLRDCFEYRFEPIALSEVESETEILRTFVGSAMSYGALSIEAHTTIARAFNELGASSNSGEGGELPERFGKTNGSKVKQVASGRFGVTYDYLRSAEEIQIKIAQGAKPGEGGHLPKQKVDDSIARVRHTKRGVNLISPPPHHDIYSIEDLAQLIYDLQTTNPQALISVKLASLFNVGTIANGVVKAGAQKVIISGFNGGTGASAKSSLKGTGLPWEYGLYQTHRSLQANRVRTQTFIQVDGQIKSGYDIIAGAILGADEFGLGTMSLIGVDCIGCKMCHTNKCPKGITTQDEKLRTRLNPDPTLLKTYLQYLAKQTRELLARLGVRSLRELRGRTDLLILPESHGIDLPWLTPAPELVAVKLQQPEFNQDKLSQATLNSITNIQRTLGVNQQTEQPQVIETTGYAGQSYGAFITNQMTLVHTGYANDYVGKGLSGGTICIRIDETTRERLKATPAAINHHFIAGNTILYGATSGTCLIEGRTGERFAVRNSGAIALNHGMGVHACEYMTGGVVVSLGDIDQNIGAGMTGGLLFAYRVTKLEAKLSEDVKAYPVEGEHGTTLKTILETYVDQTQNNYAKQILENYEQEKTNFTLITSEEYYNLSAEPDGKNK